MTIATPPKRLHSDVLTPTEHATQSLHAEFRKRIKPGLRVLDWGCGRGSDVLHLRESGIEAYGAEIAPEVIERGKPLFAQLGIDHASVIKPIAADNKTDFPDQYFDLIISYQVLEHVADLPSALREMRRVLRIGGTSVHIFPAYRRPIEGHLKMPLVHWLPKNRVRFAAIHAFTALGIEPRWKELDGFPLRQRAERYYRFSVDKTYYRSPRSLTQAFNDAGLDPSFEAHKHDRIVKTQLSKIPTPILEWLLSTFAGCIIVGERISV